MNPGFPLRLRLSALLNVLLATSFTITLLAVHSKPAGAQAGAPNQAAPAPAGAKPTSSEVEPALPSFSRGEEDLPKGSAPRTSQGHPDLSGYWIPSPKDKPAGNIGKDLPGYKLPFTEAGRAALKYNIEHTIDPESLCIVGGIPRHDASALPFQLIDGSDHVAFLYWYTTYRLIPTDGRKHSEDPDPSFFGATCTSTSR